MKYLGDAHFPVPHFTEKRCFNRTGYVSCLFLCIVNHVMQTNFSECKVSWCREAPQSGCSLLHSAVQSHFGKAML